MKNKLGFANIFIIIFVVVVAAGLGYFAVKNQTQNPPAREVFKTQEECEAKTGKSCTVQLCDYAPPGKTIEEVCGKDFKSGWVAMETPETQSAVFCDEKYKTNELVLDSIDVVKRLGELSPSNSSVCKNFTLNKGKSPFELGVYSEPGQLGVEVDKTKRLTRVVIYNKNDERQNKDPRNQSINQFQIDLYSNLVYYQDQFSGGWDSIGEFMDSGAIKCGGIGGIRCPAGHVCKYDETGFVGTDAMGICMKTTQPRTTSTDETTKSKTSQLENQKDFFSPNNFGVIKEYKKDFYVDAIVVDDINGDGKNEIIYKDTGNGDHVLLHILDSNWKVMHECEAGSSGLILPFDSDGDGKKEIYTTGSLWDKQTNWWAPYYLRVFDSNCVKIDEYKLSEMGIQGSAILNAEDIDGDGKKEVVVYSGVGFILKDKHLQKISDAKLTEKLLYEIQQQKFPEYIEDGKLKIKQKNYDIPVSAIVLGDINGDKINEIIVFSQNPEPYVGYTNIYIFNLVGELLWNYRYPTWIDTAALGDVNNDGIMELIVAGHYTDPITVFGRKI